MWEFDEWIRLSIALVVVTGIVWLLIRRLDPRLVLLGGGLALALAAGKPLAIPDAFTRAMVAIMVGPICASLGFAAVLGATGCDRHLVRLLLAPVRRTGRLLLPAGVLAAYLVNLAVPSQTSTAAAVGPVLVPLLVALGVSAERAGAVLLLGSSFGGDLLNPGAQDVQSIALATGLFARDVHARLVPAGSCGILVAALWTLFHRIEPPLLPQTPAVEDGERTSLARALIPLVPVTLLLLGYAGLPGLGWLVEVPQEKGWEGFAGALPVVRAVLIGSALALLAGWREVQALTARFFADMGAAYGSIIALTITAQCFGAGLSALGVSRFFVGLAEKRGWALGLLSIVFPGGLAVLSGSGSGPILTYAETVLRGLEAKGDLETLSALTCLAGACGRTMSPVAAVVLYCAGLVGVPPMRLVRLVLPGLLAGTLVALGIAWTGVRLF